MSQLLSDLPVGSLVVDSNTKYYGNPITWRILGHNHDGTGTTTLGSEKILCLKAFDAIEASNNDSNRQKYGNNRYSVSNILQWLNSDQTNWYSAKHSADAPPSSVNIWSNHNPYNEEAGFLTNFSEEFKNALQTVNKVTALNTVTDGGGYETVSSKIFLLSNTEVGLANENNIAEGSIYDYYSQNNQRVKYPTAEAVTNSTYTNSNFTTEKCWYWWLRSPYSSHSCYVRYVYSDGSLDIYSAYIGISGVAPACTILSSLAVSDDVDSDGCYTLVWQSESESDTASAFLDLNGLNYFYQKFLQSLPLTNSAAAHNGIPRGRDLTNIYTIDEICTKISSGTFEDLYVGDYFDVIISTSYTASEVVRCVIAGFDTYLHNGYPTSFESHHAVIVTKNCFTATAQMNSTNTTDVSANANNPSDKGGFIGSDMFQITLPIYADALQSALNNHILPHKVLLTNSVDTNLTSMAGAGLTGCSKSWEWISVTLSLLSEIQVYGANVLSSSFYDTGCDNLQLPLFALDSTAKVCRKGGTADANASNKQWYWLRNVASSPYFAGVSGDGNSTCSDASNSYGVRPIFCIG